MLKHSLATPLTATRELQDMEDRKAVPFDLPTPQNHLFALTDLLYRANLQVLRLQVADAKDPIAAVSAARALRQFEINGVDRRHGARLIAQSMIDLADQFGVEFHFVPRVL